MNFRSIISSGTRNARKNLKEICSESELDKFIKADFKKLSGKISNVSTLFTYANVKSKKATETFAIALNNNSDNMEKFFNAVEKQAKSAGTKKSGLFYKLIYTNVYQKVKNDDKWNENDKTLKQFEKELRKFLLARKGQDIEETEAPEGLEELTDEEKAKKDNQRKNNSNVIEKLKSGRLSDRLKVFMALVLWKYMTDRIKYLSISQHQPKVNFDGNVVSEPEPAFEPVDRPTSGPIADPAPRPTPTSGPTPAPTSGPALAPTSRPAPTPVPISKPSAELNPGSESQKNDKSEIAKERKLSSIDAVIPKIFKIYTYPVYGSEMSGDDQGRLIIFKSIFDDYFKGDVFNPEKLRSDLQNGQLDLDTIESQIGDIWSLVSKTMVKDLTNPKAKALVRESETALVQDLVRHFERGDGNLDGKVEGFRDIVNHARRQDGDIDLSFHELFFEQKFMASYRTQDTVEIFKKWGVSDSIHVGSYRKNCSLEMKLKEILSKWFPGCKAEDYNGEVPIINYIFDIRFEALINSKKDDFSPRLFVRILYSFEQEAERLKITPEDLNHKGDKAKDMSEEQNKLREFWSGAKTVLISMAPGCSVQVQKAINKMAEFYDAYQSSKDVTETVSETNASPMYDRKFCQLLREEATNRAVSSCRSTQDGASAPDFARLIKSIFTPLVSVADSGYHSEPLLTNFGETYQSLAIKWKDAISSFDLIRNTFEKIYLGMNDQEKEQFEKYADIPVSFEDFISVIRSTDKRDRSAWENEIKSFYQAFRSDFDKHFGKPDDNTYSDADKQDLENMEKWINKQDTLTFKEFQTLLLDTFCDIMDQNSSTYKLFENAKNIRTISYIFHLVDSKMVTIN